MYVLDLSVKSFCVYVCVDGVKLTVKSCALTACMVKAISHLYVGLNASLLALSAKNFNIQFTLS